MKKAVRKILWMRVGVAVIFALACIVWTGRMSPAQGAFSIRVAFVPELPPYQMEENGEYAGMHIELMDAIAKQQNFILEYMPMRTMTACREALQDGRCDVILGVLGNDSGYLYSDELSDSSIALVVTNAGAEILDSSESSNLRMFAYEYGTMRSIAAVYFTLARSWQVESSQVNAFQKLISGRVDGMYGVQSSILYQLRASGLEEQYTIYHSNVQPVEYRAAVLQENYQILEVINKGLQVLRANGNYDVIAKRWEQQLVQNPEISLGILWKRYGDTISLILSIMAMLTAGLFFWNRTLNKRVAEKTAELQSMNEELQTEMARSRYENSLRQIVVESSPNALLLLNGSMEISMVNQAGVTLLQGVSDAVGTKVSKYPLLERMLTDKKQALMRDGRTFMGQELTDMDEAGQERTYQYHLIPVMEREQVVNILLNIQDITQSIEREKEIATAEKNRVLNRVVAGIAHEIRNPLMAIKTFAQLLNIRKDQQEFIDFFADIVPTEVDRIERLVGNLVSYSSPIKTEISAFPVSGLVDSCVNLLHLIARQNKIEFSISVEEGLYLTASLDQIKQVMINILMNSIQAIQEKKQTNGHDGPYHISIRSYRDGQSVRIEVEDDGIGMTKETMAHFSEPFYTSKATGTGLGMMVSRRYVEANRGTMYAESEWKHYTKIVLVFPMQNTPDRLYEEEM